MLVNKCKHPEEFQEYWLQSQYTVPSTRIRAFKRCLNCDAMYISSGMEWPSYFYFLPSERLC